MNAVAPPREIVVPGIAGQNSERITIPVALLEQHWKWDHSDDARSRTIFQDIRAEVRYEFEDVRQTHPAVPADEIVAAVLPRMVRHVVFKHDALARAAQRDAEEKARRDALTPAEREAEDVESERRCDEFWSQVHVVDEDSFVNLPDRGVEYVGFRDDADLDIEDQDREFDQDWFSERPGQRFRLCTAFEREVAEAGWEPRGKHTVLRLSTLEGARLFEVRCDDVPTINAASDEQLAELFNYAAGAKTFVKVGHYTPRPVAKKVDPSVKRATHAPKPIDMSKPYEARCLADIEREPIKWLWPGRIPLGKITQIAGDPKLGKSQITCTLAAALSTGGSFPGGTSAPRGSVIFITCEDDPEDTIGPRLDAAGADSRKIYLLDWTVRQHGGKSKRQHFDIGQDAEALEAMIRDIGDVKAVIIDPISAYMGKADSYKTADVRGALVPMQTLAYRHSVAVILVSHLNKNTNSQNAKARVAGAGFVAVSRSNWLVAEDPADETRQRRFLCPLGTNIDKGDTGFAFSIQGVDLGGGIKTSKVVFEDQELELNADDLLGGRQEAPSALAVAEDFISAALKDGPQPRKQIEDAAQAGGISEASLRRAKKQLGVLSKKDGAGAWLWSLPPVVMPDRRGTDLW